MCAAVEPVVLSLLRREPALVIAALHRLLGWQLDQPVRAEPGDPGDTQVHARGREWCADLVFALRRLDGGASWLAVVAPAARDEFERAYIWPCLAASLAVRQRGPAGLLALVPRASDRAWARRTVTCGFGALTFTPLAVGVDQLLALRQALRWERRRGREP